MMEPHIYIEDNMIYNSDLTIYHKSLDEKTKLEKWTRYNYRNIWWFSGNNASASKGYEESNNVEIRIPYNLVKEEEVIDFGDIFVKGYIEKDITKQSDLDVELYNIVGIKKNKFGKRPHIHLTGK